MRVIPGHRAPLGSTTRMRMRWHGEEPPQLLDVCVEQPVECERAYRVVGIEEHRDSPAVWWLLMERLPFYVVTVEEPAWGFTRDRR